MCESLKLNRKETPSNQVNENSSKNTPKMTKKKNMQRKQIGNKETTPNLLYIRQKILYKRC
jgi:hypothetical protein